MKRCTGCGKMAGHGPNRARRSGFQSQCRSCLNAQRLGNYYTWRDEMLAGRCCWRCGSTKELEFDHMDPTLKTANVSEVWGNRAKARAEANKCWVLCTDCHVERSVAEGHYSGLKQQES